ncbi:MAG: LysE/ArgO family amino acid transporter [Tropicimonas sp.]|uniref:LysE/ArgO family amino acid transporter n=1 Tax=Tropicimonas sp. TaxID=2067044 RepID=UPI003A8A1CCA
MFDVFVQGFAVSFGLILALGAQNAFVLRQGLRREHVLGVVLTCALSDAGLTALGIYAFTSAAALLPGFLPAMRWGGAAFLLAYGGLSFRRAWRGCAALSTGQGGALTLRQAVLASLALTWLNPHVYLDTFGLIGSVSAGFPGRQGIFAAGAITASFFFFFTFGFGARLLQPFFVRPGSWRLLDASIGVLMWSIAAGLLSG